MANLLQAVAQYRPRVTHTRTIELDELAGRLARGSLVTKSVARMVLEDLSDEIRYAMRTSVLVDPALRDNLLSVADFTGQIDRRQNVGLDLAALKLLWDAEHPDDPLELPVSAAAASNGDAT
jgi:hypothetical protein